MSGGATLHRYTSHATEPRHPTLVNEASMGGYVALAETGASVTVANPVDLADAFVIRFSVPPSDVAPHFGTEGTLDLYVDGQFRQSITLHSKFAYVYRTGGMRNEPIEGAEVLRQYNEFRFRLEGAPLAKGCHVTLKKGRQNLLEVYNIDLIDFEKIEAPLPMPEGAISVVDFGAVGDGVVDNTMVFQNAANTAAAAGKPLWIPAGTFLLSAEKSHQWRLNNVTVRGAGIWHTTLLRKPPVGSKRKHRTSIVMQGASMLSDVYIKNELYYEGDYAILASGKGWRVERIWTHNTGPCWMSGSDGVIRDSRMSDHWGDGININNSNKNTPETVGHRLSVINNFIRNSGDDGIAHFSDADSGLGQRKNSMMEGCIIENNTVIAP